MLDRVATQSERGALVGISQQAVSDFDRQHRVSENITAAGWLQLYCRHLREEAAGRAGRLADASAALKERQREEVELRLAIKRRQFAPITDLEAAIAYVAARVASILEGLVPALSRRCPQIDADALAVIEEVVAKARQAAAEMSLDVLTKDDTDGGEGTA